MKRAAIHTLGCRLNQAESTLIRDQLTAAGYTLVPFGAPADLGVIHTCTVTREADAKSRQMIRQFIRANPGARTVVIGCYAETGAKTVAAIEGVDLVLGNRDKLELVRHLEALDAGGAQVVRGRMGREPFTLDWQPGGPPVTERINLKIQDGCDFMCSFCIIPFARGRSRPRVFDDLVGEAGSLVRRGVRELVLSGINVGDYAFEDKGLAAVVDALNQIPGLARVRIGSIELTTIPEALFERMADPDHLLVPYLHIPLQSGSDRILAKMRRNYTGAEFLAFLARAVAAVPGIGLGTDILVGFPGETAVDFQDTCRILESSPFQYAHIFKYSERPGSAAARMEEKVDPAAMAARSAALHALDARRRRDFMARHVGREVTVLFETREHNWWSGYTQNYLRAAVQCNENLNNRLGRVQVTSVGEEWAHGRLLDVY